jgi:hypothetical protein
VVKEVVEDHTVIAVKEVAEGLKVRKEAFPRRSERPISYRLRRRVK